MLIKKEDRVTTIGDSKREGAPNFTKWEMAPIENLYGSGRLFSTITLPVGAQVPTHYHHNEFEIYCMLTGEGDYNDNGNIIRIKAGDTVICPDGEMHGLINNSDAELSFVAFVGFPNEAKM